jgi:hypothetical protein
MFPSEPISLTALTAVERSVHLRLCGKNQVRDCVRSVPMVLEVSCGCRAIAVSTSGHFDTTSTVMFLLSTSERFEILREDNGAAGDNDVCGVSALWVSVTTALGTARNCCAALGGIRRS